MVYRDSDNERYFVYIEVLKTKKKNMLSVLSEHRVHKKKNLRGNIAIINQVR